MRSSLACFLAATALLGCGGDDGVDPDAAPIDAAVDAPTDAVELDGPFVAPTMLSQTGLYSDIGTKALAPGVLEYTPRWELWSDAAVKRRWIWLPPGTQIDTTTDMDFWSFPPGTKLWKEFVRDGRRIETRLLEKHGLEDDVASWFMVSFQWDTGETDAVAVPGGVVDDAGVNDIPDRAKCRSCHQPSRNRSVVLGFQALSLDFDAPDTMVDLADLVADNRVSTPPVGTGSPYFPMPEVGATDPARPALGYLHANCGGCHNQHSDVQNTVPLDLRLRTDAAFRMPTWAATPAYTTAVNVTATLTTQGPYVVRGGDTAQSALFNRLDVTGGGQMPPFGREQIDTTAVETMRTWINSLPPPN